MKDMKLTLIDKKYTVEMDSHEYIKYIAYKLGIPVEKGNEVSLKEYYTNMVEIFRSRLSRTKDPMMNVANTQEYARALHTISMMFDHGEDLQTEIVSAESKVVNKIDLTKKTDSCTYIPELDIYVKDYGTGIDLDYKRLWYTNEFDTLMEVSYGWLYYYSPNHRNELKNLSYTLINWIIM